MLSEKTLLVMCKNGVRFTPRTFPAGYQVREGIILSGNDRRRVVLMTEIRGSFFYGSYGVAPFMHPTKGILVPVAKPALGEYGILSELLSDAFEAVATERYEMPSCKLQTRMMLHDRQGGKCYYCEKPVTAIEATIDHRIPLARGGQDNDSNTALACSPCNNKKGCKTDAEFFASL